MNKFWTVDRVSNLFVAACSLIGTAYIVVDHLPKVTPTPTDRAVVVCSSTPTWAWVLVALCAAILLSNLVRLVATKNHFNWPWNRVLIQDAAQQAYEAAERAEVLEYFILDGPSPLYRLETFKHVFLVDDEAVLYGAKPPSTVVRPIPREEYNQLHPIEGTNQLSFLGTRDVVAYTDVTVSAKDLARIKSQWPVQAKAAAARFRKR
jgi:hypothetical protein